jgi:hypothetical protein
MREGNFLSPIIFHDSRESKMHDSLPPELLSPKTLSYILCPDNHLSGVIMIVPWCLLVTALTLLEISTQTRSELLDDLRDERLRAADTQNQLRDCT